MREQETDRAADRSIYPVFRLLRSALPLAPSAFLSRIVERKLFRGSNPPSMRKRERSRSRRTDSLHPRKEQGKELCLWICSDVPQERKDTQSSESSSRSLTRLFSPSRIVKKFQASRLVALGISCGIGSESVGSSPRDSVSISCNIS